MPDIRKILDGLKNDRKYSRRIDFDKVSLIGHSLGGYTMLGLVGAWSSWKLPGISSIVALSPYVAPFVNQNSLANIDIPVMYQGGTLDFSVTPDLEKKGGAYDQTPAPVYLLKFSGAGHFAWTNFRTSYHEQIAKSVIEFLDKHMKKKSMTDIITDGSSLAEFRVKLSSEKVLR